MSFHGPYQLDPWHHIVEIHFGGDKSTTVLDFVTGRYLVKGMLQSIGHVINHPEWRVANVGLDLISNRNRAEIAPTAHQSWASDWTGKCARIARIINGHPDFLAGSDNDDAHDCGAFDQVMRLYEGRVLTIEFNIADLKHYAYAPYSESSGFNDFFVNDGEGGPPLYQTAGYQLHTTPLHLGWNNGASATGYFVAGTEPIFAISQGMGPRRATPGSGAETIAVRQATFCTGPVPETGEYFCQGWWPAPADIKYFPVGSTPPSDEDPDTIDVVGFYHEILGSVLNPQGWNEPPGSSGFFLQDLTSENWYTLVTALGAEEGTPFIETAGSMVAFDSRDTADVTKTRLAGGTWNPDDPPDYLWYDPWHAKAEENLTSFEFGINRVSVGVTRKYLIISVNGKDPVKVILPPPHTEAQWKPNRTVTDAQSKFARKSYYHFIDDPEQDLPANGWGDDYGDRSTEFSDADNVRFRTLNSFLGDNFARFGNENTGFSGWIRFLAVKKTAKNTPQHSLEGIVKRYSRITSPTTWWVQKKDGTYKWTGYG